MTAKLCESTARWLGERFVCSKLPRGQVRVRTPFLYPDGDVIDVYVVERAGRIDVTDFGEALGWLRLQTPATRRTPRQNRLIQDVLLTQGVETFRGQIVARCPKQALVPDGVLRVSQAALRIGDLWYTMRVRSVESLSDQVADVLEERRIPFEREVKLPGRSGRIWTVDFQTRTPERSSLVSVLASGSRAAARRVTEHAVAKWHDLSNLRIGPQAVRFVSLFDDASDVWSSEDFKLVEDLSDVARWSHPEGLLQMLGTAP